MLNMFFEKEGKESTFFLCKLEMVILKYAIVQQISYKRAHTTISIMKFSLGYL